MEDHQMATGPQARYVAAFLGITKASIETGNITNNLDGMLENATTAFLEVFGTGYEEMILGVANSFTKKYNKWLKEMDELSE